ncbi:MAG: hypothetical protein VB118_11315 [Oscillospiraceae bacterium]|nr:hypothetical protein [Oscillospiraceae bacterium]
MRILEKAAMAVCAALYCLILFPSIALADKDDAVKAQNITEKVNISGISESDQALIFDGDTSTYLSLSSGKKLILESSESISSIYIIWHRIPSEWSLSGNGKTSGFGKFAFLHEYINVAGALGNIYTLEITLPEKESYIAEIYAFSEGMPPSWVQTWLPPLEKADIMLLSTHADDEHLFYAGLIPYYVTERKAAVQVVYFTYHYASTGRQHEQLDGLWAAGLKNYPVIGRFPDLYSESLEDAYSVYSDEGFKESDFITYQLENIRRFKPQVIIGHDIKGEYSHGAHILNTETLLKALSLENDAEAYPDSAAKYGIWKTPKVYLHLYTENPIELDYDIPLASLGGKTPFEVSQASYAYHLSQQWTWFTKWIRGTNSAKITKASQIKTYSPCLFGLYRSNVGLDINKNDFFENITLYSESENIPPETNVPGNTGEKELTGGLTETGEQAETGEFTETGTAKPVIVAPQTDSNMPLSEEQLEFLKTYFPIIALCIMLSFLFTLLYISGRRKSRRRRKK